MEAAYMHLVSTGHICCEDTAKRTNPLPLLDDHNDIGYDLTDLHGKDGQELERSWHLTDRAALARLAHRNPSHSSSPRLPSRRRQTPASRHRRLRGSSTPLSPSLARSSSLSPSLAVSVTLTSICSGSVPSSATVRRCPSSVDLVLRLRRSLAMYFLP